jgi:Zn-dependent protease with chaperone function
MTGSPSQPLASGTIEASERGRQWPGVAAPHTGASIEVSFLDEQRRRRREIWRLSFLCFLIALGLGLAMSTIFGPLLLALAGGLLKLVAWGGCGNPCRGLAHGIGSFARYELATVVAAVGHGLNDGASAGLLVIVREWAVVSIVLAPAMIAAAWAWVVIRRTLARAALVDLVASTQARSPRPEDNKERQLLNVADEMALAAGLPAPRVLLIDSEVVNAGVAGVSHEAATVVATRGLLDRLSRDELQAVMAHCIASAGNGDLRLMQSVLATLQTLGLFHTILDLPFRWSAWPALANVMRATLSRRASPATVRRAADGIEESFDAESIPVPSVFIVPLLPFRFVTLFQRFILMMWCMIVLNWPMALMWRARRYLADSTALQLTRNPDAFASALSQMMSLGGIPPGGEHREYMFVCGATRRGGGFDRYGVTMAMHPRLDKRLKRLGAMGASSRSDRSNAPSRLRMAIGLVIFVVIASPFLVLMVLAALGGVGAVLWLSFFTVFISLLLGLGFLSWAFG